MQSLSTKPTVIVTGSFDNVRSSQIRFLHEASRLGNVHVILWSDKMCFILDGKEPKFSEAERTYFLESIRYVSQVTTVKDQIDPDKLPRLDQICPKVNNLPIIWAVDKQSDNAQKKAYCDTYHLEYHVLSPDILSGFPLNEMDAPLERTSRRRVVVTGCYDWLHSGHVRFFEEASEFGDLFVVVGHDENLRLLKGEGHPLFPENERRYMVQSIRFVTQAQISSGNGWMDAEPEIAIIKPDYYVVNEDGDKPEKRLFCAERGIEYKILKRLPKPGLPRRESTALRGF